MTQTCSIDMLLMAAAGFRQLDPPAARRVVTFARDRQMPDGGFRGRGGGSDIYFTVFGLGVLGAAGAIPERRPLADYLAGFGTGEGLDFVHRVCLVRCLSVLSDLGRLPAFMAVAVARSGLLERLVRMRAARPPSPRVPAGLVDALAPYRTQDGGYEQDARQRDCASAYACFLAWLAYQDAGHPMPQPDALLACLATLRREDGSYANARSVNSGATTATAAAVVLLCEAGLPVADITRDGLLQRRDAAGGFRAGVGTPVPDLLSTASALYALSRAGALPPDGREPDEDFVSSLWNEDGGFSGHTLDAESDVEYTFYALLALGCLADGVIE